MRLQALLLPAIVLVGLQMAAGAVGKDSLGPEEM